MKLSTAIKYRFKYQMKAALFFFGYFLLFSIAFPLIGIFVSGTDSNVNSDMLFASMLFMVILAFIGVSSDFKLFIQNGMSRNNIFLSSLISNFTLSLIISCILLGIKQFGNGLLTQKLSLTLFFVDIYTKENLMTSFLLLFIFLLFASSIGSIMSVFNDRVTGYKKLFVIATLIMIPILVSLLVKIISPDFKTSIFSFILKSLGIYPDGNKPFSLVLSLFVIFIVLSIITYLMNYKREIKRINA
ncbi:hypothetical protein [Vagococcus carniphilus]|uniref:hypothetical protein n=1 Tax=Vagococcus carniphilus TaxID=218144 RepID=UPI0028912405|nr:hypothetical protein [Vagococcus carniphilus]MDT2839557.1 hypothetical protein [Vagococcus carniphilus]